MHLACGAQGLSIMQGLMHLSLTHAWSCGHSGSDVHSGRGSTMSKVCQISVRSVNKNLENKIINLVMHSYCLYYTTKLLY